MGGLDAYYHAIRSPNFPSGDDGPIAAGIPFRAASESDTPMGTQLARHVVLLVLTVAAGVGMFWLNQRDTTAQDQARDQVTAPVPVVARMMPRVAVAHLEPARHEVTVKFAGKIRPWETYSIGFEVPGRMAELGTDLDGRMIDDGSRVEAGQLLARLDQRVLVARRGEAVAQFEQSSSDLSRARQLLEGGLGGITEAEYQQALTNHALAKAQLEVATKNLEDATLVAPVGGTISRRMAKPGEPVTAHQVIFELLEDDQMVLVVDVPERDIASLQQRMQQVKSLAAASVPGGEDEEQAVFRARVVLESRDAFGQLLPPIDAEVHQIAEVADPRTGLFEVEIRVPNDSRQLRAGMVATAEIVVDRVSAFRVPESATLFTKDRAFVYRVAKQLEPRQVMFWKIDEAPVARADRVELTQWVDQGDFLLVPSSTADLQDVVVRGQQRLADGERVRIVGAGEATAPVVSAPAAEETSEQPGVARRNGTAPAPSER